MDDLENQSEVAHAPGPDPEILARERGWIPLDNFKGDASRWVDAETFLEKSRTVMPILRKNNEKLYGELATVRNELSETKRTLNEALESLNEFKRYHEEDSKRQYEKARQELIVSKKDALRDGDYDTVIEVDEALGKLEQREAKLKVQAEIKPVPQAVSDPTQDPVFQKWVYENADWFQKDQEKTSYAVSVANHIKNVYPNLTGLNFLNKVKEEVDIRFAPKEEIPAKKLATDKVEGSRLSHGTTAQGRGKSYRDLPREAKEACDTFATSLVGPNKAFEKLSDWQDRYAKDYFGEQ